MSKVQDLKVQILDSVILALREDIGSGDITSNAIIPAGRTVTANIIAKAPGVFCGLGIAQLVFKSIDKSIDISFKVKDGDTVKPGKVIAIVKGPARAILTAERTVLNFLQHMSGIATLTGKFVKAAGKRVKILDTRKTIPGLRALEKYAVDIGGGNNHRLGLFDAVLIKDNHISVVGDLVKAVEYAARNSKNVEVEAKTMAQVSEAVRSKATRILLDNMTIAQIKKAVRMIRSAKRKIEIEISGGVNLKNIAALSRTGADFISVGAITHSAPAMDISLKVI